MGQYEVWKIIQDHGGKASLAQMHEALSKQRPGMTPTNARDYIDDSLRKLVKHQLIRRVSLGVYEITAPFPERNVIQIKNGRARRVKQ